MENENRPTYEDLVMQVETLQIIYNALLLENQELAWLRHDFERQDNIIEKLSQMERERNEYRFLYETQEAVNKDLRFFCDGRLDELQKFKKKYEEKLKIIRELKVELVARQLKNEDLAQRIAELETLLSMTNPDSVTRRRRANI